MKEITSIIVDYNSIEHTIMAIDTLLKYENELIDKVIIVDNYGLKDYSLIFEKFKDRVMVIRPGTNVGFGRAINLAMNHVQTPYVLLQNPDTYLEGKVLHIMLEYLKKHASAVVPVAKTPEGLEFLARRFTKPLDILAGRRSPLLKFNFFKKIGEKYRYLDKKEEKEPFEVDAFTGTFVLFRKEAFSRAGGFDRRFFLFMEDIDLSRRLRQKGYKISVLPSVFIRHSVGATRGKVPMKSGFAKAKSVYMYLSKWGEIKGTFKYFVGLLLALYTILISFMNFIDFQRPELSWRKHLKERR